MLPKETLCLTPNLLDRLSFFSNGPVSYDEEEGETKSARAFYGVLYGLRLKELSNQPVILNCSGNSIYVGEEVPENLDVEFLTELFPVGLDPVGVFYLSSENDDIDEKKVLAKLIDALPDQEAFVHDPVVLTKSGSDQVQTFSFTEGEFKSVDHESLELSEIEKHFTTIRLRGKLELFASANDHDIVSWIRHTIEKVASPYGTFKLDKSDVFFLHTFEPVRRGATGSNLIYS